MGSSTGDAPFELTEDPAHGRISVTLRGFWDAEIFQRYVETVLRAEERMGAGGRRFDYLCDASAFQVQGRDVATLFETILAEPGPGVRRIAVVMPSALSRMQGARLVRNEAQALFDSRADALAWLDA